MASRKSFLSKNRYIFPSSTELLESRNLNPEDGGLELDEAEVWNLSNTVTEAKKGLRCSLKRVNPVASTSLPVSIPDWSKILKEEYKKREIDNEDDDEKGIRVPPHEYLARTRGASLSVHEGVGRTLKGRDLRSVRNAIWKKVGFED
ncbi:hypothetical protein RJT34_19815 [Clitoria ternatea]|uniref:Senescence regulator S40 n=1 Tax=Clitoria ternatea TaxID=43366 RepID=A0AAN9IRQ7_CLITE